MSRESDLQVSNMSFPDFDLDEGDLGGLLEWQRPSTTGSSVDFPERDGLWMGVLWQRDARGLLR